MKSLHIWLIRTVFLLTKSFPYESRHLLLNFSLAHFWVTYFCNMIHKNLDPLQKQKTAISREQKKIIQIKQVTKKGNGPPQKKKWEQTVTVFQIKAKAL